MAYTPRYHAEVYFTDVYGRLGMHQTLNYVNRADAEKEAYELEGVLMQIGCTNIKTNIREIRC
jgi:alkyl hydroperoxide reductase subunit AhpF